MGLTLKSLQADMHNGFKETSFRIDQLDAKVNQLDINLNERIDNLSLSLNRHIKDTAYNFCCVNERFDEMERRFDRFPGELINSMLPYFNNIEKMLANHENQI